MGREVTYSDAFRRWWDGLSVAQQAIAARVELLERYGPALGRPVVGSIRGSRYSNMKELRCSRSGALRVLFIFDPLRTAVMLLGGDKAGDWRRWYERAVPEADAQYTLHLRGLGAGEAAG